MSAIVAPDVETSGAGYAARFSGAAGRYLLDVQRLAVERALEGLAPGTLLEVGGGHGQLCESLGALGWDVTVHGTDTVCETHLRRLHGRTQPKFLLGPLERLPAASCSYDVVLAVRLLSHVPAWPALLAEMCRVARRAVVFDYPATTGLNALTPLLFGLKRRLEGNTRTYSRFPRRALRRECARHGFVEARVVKQFLLPMVVHRTAGGARWLQGVEAAGRAAGLTQLAGSPGIYRADRAASRETP
ncbi:MAG: class I SAM-dependent methyltransferase [Steroidobacteraceae bacterium]|jgi:2-polyprenyl-3-methyl-5-hydroxy-6-metoxy-1,4-benzoquinol methylase|nr:class I SAM-dependent methyltransferase [Steroidobacteraceae bacterium]